MAINLHEGQSEVYRDLFIDRTHRFLVVCCSRGWGKSYDAAVSAITAVHELIELHGSVPNKYVWIIAPTYDQVTDIYYPLINYDLGMEHVALRSYREQGRFVFEKGVELRLISYEAVERIRGKGAYFVVWDEVSSCRRGIKPQEAWDAVIMPALTTRWSQQRADLYKAKSAGRALIIGTPKGYNFFAELMNREEVDPKWKTYKYDYTQSPFLDPVEIEALRHTLDPITFASEYLALVAESGNNVFYCFDRKIHVTNELLDFIPPKMTDAQRANTLEIKRVLHEHELEDFGEDVNVCIDFNVGKMCSSMFALRGSQMEFLDEVQGHPDTEMLAISLVQKYKGHRIYAYPDPSGRAKKSSAAVGKTDFAILESYGIQCIAHPKAAPIIDSVACVNKKLKTAAGDIGMYFHPRCVNTIKSVERTTWLDRNQDTATIDKSENIEHFSDGIRYATEKLFPIQSTVTRARRGFGF
jgi:hypothetical protein